MINACSKRQSVIKLHIVFPRKDAAATIYFTSTAMRRLFEVQTSWLLFISVPPQCGDYSKVATIRSTDIAATIYFSTTSMRRLFEVTYYSARAPTIRGGVFIRGNTVIIVYISYAQGIHVLSQLNNKLRVVVTDFIDCTIPAVYGFTH